MKRDTVVPHLSVRRYSHQFLELVYAAMYDVSAHYDCFGMTYRSKLGKFYILNNKYVFNLYVLIIESYYANLTLMKM